MRGPHPDPAGTPPAARRAAELTELGGFAVLEMDRDGLLPLTTALDPDHLTQRFAATRAGLSAGTGVPLAQVPARTAVSAAQMGLVSRFWSIALASLALHDRVPDLTPEGVWVHPGHRNPSPLAVTGAGRAVSGAAEAVAVLEALVVRGAVAAVTQACAEHGRTSRQVLVSNAASSLVASAGVLGGQVPPQAGRLDVVVRLLLGRPWLAAGGGYRQDVGFTRAGCCLYYRLPGHGLCSDCVLVRARPAGRRAGRPGQPGCGSIP